MQDHRMRPGQHNSKRSRGRSRGRHPGGGGGSSSSGGGNPINRVYESNGPDVKVRGTAQTVADKYLQLGRDAQSSGDNIMAENFYQHAEHYLRILSAAQAYNQQYQQQQQQYRRPPGDEMFDEDGSDEGGEGEGSYGQPQGSERPPQYSQEPQPQSAPAEPAIQQSEERETQPQPQAQQPRSRDYGRERRSSWDNRREGEERSRPPHPRNEAPAQPVAETQGGEAVPQPVSPPASSKEGWDGPQPSFLKRPSNGSGTTRSRSER